MKRLSGIISGPSWLLLYGATYLFLALLFYPPWQGLLWFFAVDFVALFAMLASDRLVSERWYPRLSPGKIEERLADPARIAPADRTAFLEEVTGFPLRRAVYCSLSSFFKAIPGTVVIALAWGEPPLRAAAKAMLAGGVMYAYFFGCIYIESHEWLSAALARLHGEQDWTQAFAAVKFRSAADGMDRCEAIALGCVWIFGTLLLVVEAQSPPALVPKTVSLLGINLVGLLLFTRLWVLSRRYFHGGLERVFRAVSAFSPDRKNPTLALHTTPMLAAFEGAVNRLLGRIQAYERELSRLVNAQLDRSRFIAIGEISGLVAHDLIPPLHAIQVCAEAFAERPELAEAPEYRKRLMAASERALALVVNLRSYLRGQDTREDATSLRGGFDAVTMLLKVQFHEKKLPTIALDGDPALAASMLRIGRSELVHVLWNLIANAVKVLEGRSDGAIRLRAVGRDGRGLVVHVGDNGPGLSPALFEQLTATQYDVDDEDGAAKGSLGLRLVRRLLERRDCTLRLLSDPAPGERTTFELTFPLAERNA